MTHISPPIGQEISCVMKEVDSIYLKRKNVLNQFVADILKQEKFNVLKTLAYQFEPQGFTTLILLSESHVAIHTYPEYNALYFSVYSCRGPNDAERTFQLLKEKLAPKEITFLNCNKIPLMSEMRKIIITPVSKKRKNSNKQF
ncbi:MAG: adenosylmethionine decarboxylase [Nanoarchaeota archaeon]